MEINALLKVLADHDGSDLYLSTGAPPSAKFGGELTPLSEEALKRGEVEAIARSIMNADQSIEFDRELEMNLAIALEGIGRFRLSIFRQRNEVSIVARNIQTEIPKFDDLGLPQILKEVITTPNGLVLFVGGTGSGKSTSLAALIDHRNSHKGGHIITIEDPVEFIHPHKKCIVNQREIGVDALSFHSALKSTLRQGPDVVLIGEIRDRDTMEHALNFAETGVLAISTLHANNANQALDRIINFFPEERKTQLLNDLANNLRAIVSQRLIPTTDGKRCAAVEILLGSPTIKQLIIKDQLIEIKEAMHKSENSGMKTFDSALFDLVMEGRISEEDALKNADSVNNLRLKFKLRKPLNEEEEDDNPLLMRGQLPSQIAAAKAAEQLKKSQESQEAKRIQAIKAAELAKAKLEAIRQKKAQNSSKPGTTDQAAIHQAMAASLAKAKSNKPNPPPTESSSEPPHTSLQKAAQDLSLSLTPEKQEEKPDDPSGLGMGKIG